MKPSTYFVDIDGVLRHHMGEGIRGQLTGDVHAIASTIETLNEIEGEGHHIVLTTAVPKTYEHATRLWLERHRVPYHQLVMGVTSGTRYLVNDAKPGGPPSAVAIVVERNAGWARKEP